MWRRLASFAVLAGPLLAAAGAAETPDAVSPEGRGAPDEAGDRRWVEVTPLRWGSEGKLTMLADGEKEIRLTAVEAGPAMVCDGGGGSAVRCGSEVIEDGATLAVPATPGLAVTGRLLEGRDPVGGARVAVLPAGLTARRPFTLPLALDPSGRSLERLVPTEERGRFSIPPLAPGEYRLEITLPGGRVERTGPFRVPDPEEHAAARAGGAGAAAGSFDLGDVSLGLGLAVEFFAWAPGVGPLDGVDVGALQGEGDSVLLFAGRTDPDGRAALHGFRPDEPVHASCSAAGFLRHEQRYPEPPRLVECRLLALAALEGVVESDSRGLPGATVSLVAADRRATRTATGEDGGFLLEGLAPGAYRLVAAAADHRWEELPIELAAGERRRLPPIALTPASMIDGVVRDALDGTPIAGASLVAVEPAGVLAVTTDEEGRFGAPLPEEGDLIVMVAAAAYARREARLPAGADLGDEPWNVDLDPGGRIRATVWNEDGETPCAGCTVVVAPRGGSSALVESARTSLQGIAETGPLAPGHYQVVLEEVRSLGSVVTVRSGDDLREAEVVNGRTTEVFFLPKSAVEIRFWPPPPPGWRLSARGGGERRVLDPASPGTFTVPRHRGEPLELSLFRNGITVAQGWVPADFRDPVLELPLPATQVLGRLETAEVERALEVEVVPLSSGAPRAAWAVADREGGFRIPFLPPGAYGLVADGALLATFQLADRQALDLGVLDPRPGPLP